MKVVWSPLALQKLGDAAEFISLDNPGAAENWVNESSTKQTFSQVCLRWDEWFLSYLIPIIAKSSLVTIESYIASAMKFAFLRYETVVRY